MPCFGVTSSLIKILVLDKEFLLGFIQKINDLTFLYRWKTLKKLVNGRARLKVINESLQRHAGAFKNRRAP